MLCSGYGLSESFEHKQGLNNFWSNKIVKIWIPCFLKLSFFAIVFSKGIRVWLTDHPLFLYGWYLQVLFAEYLVFWVLFRFVENKAVRLIGLFSASLVAFLCIRSQLYAEQLLCFPLGVAFSQLQWKDIMQNWKRQKKLLLMAGCFATAAAAFLFRNRFSNELLFNAVWLLFKLSIAILVCFLPYYLRRIRIFSIFIPLGVISYMLYLINNDILSLLEGNAYWYTIIATLLLLLVSATAFKWISDKLALKIDRCIRKTSRI